jgi:hypothetical protein
MGFFPHLGAEIQIGESVQGAAVPLPTFYFINDLYFV